MTGTVWYATGYLYGLYTIYGRGAPAAPQRPYLRPSELYPPEEAREYPLGQGGMGVLGAKGPWPHPNLLAFPEEARSWSVRHGIGTSGLQLVAALIDSSLYT